MSKTVTRQELLGAVWSRPMVRGVGLARMGWGARGSYRSTVLATLVGHRQAGAALGASRKLLLMSHSGPTRLADLGGLPPAVYATRMLENRSSELAA